MALSSRFIPALAMSLLSAVLIHAQEPKPILAGRVTQAENSSPIAGATITLLPPFIAGRLNLQTARTDSNGNYRFEKVVEGTYSVTASADGFVHQDYNRDASPDGAFLRVSSSNPIQGIDFQLKPEAVIRGTVTDNAGKPVADLDVTAVAQQTTAKTPSHPVPIASTKTDASGQFVLKGLPADTYLVCANEPAGYGASRNWYRETWYGGTASSEGAIPIALKERGERIGVRIAVEREARYRIVVWPSGPEGESPPDRYDVTIQHRNHTSSKQADGSYVIPGIPAGHYTLVSTAWSGVQYVGQGEEDFAVSEADVSLHVHVGGLGEMGGTVLWEGARRAPFEKTLFLIESEEGAAQGVHVDELGRFHVSRVLPGKYRFKPLSAAPVVVLRSVQCEGKEVREDLPLLIGDRAKVLDCRVTLANP
jgi:Carboxypeptidase regulatory-like domain